MVLAAVVLAAGGLAADQLKNGVAQISHGHGINSFGIQTQERLGVGGAQVKPPGTVLGGKGDAVQFINHYVFTGVGLTYPGYCGGELISPLDA